MESTKTNDYAISRVKKSGLDSFQIKFTRRGRSQMPLDFSVTGVDGNQYDFHIPNTWFAKKTTAMVLPKWYGWDRLQQRYSCSLFIPSGIKEVVIDPGFRLADIYMLNNYKKFPARLYFDSQVNNLPDWKQYQLYWRPDIWYNAVDGIKAGLHLESRGHSTSCRVRVGENAAACTASPVRKGRCHRTAIALQQRCRETVACSRPNGMA